MTGCTEPECGLELLVDSVANDSVIMVIPTGYPEGVELVYTLNGEVFQEGGMAMTLPYAIGNGPWQACVQYITEDCPEGVVECVSSDDYDPDCPQEIWVGGAGCEFILSICDFTEGEQVFWEFSDSTTAEGHFTWHTFEENGWYEACATYVSPTCPDTTVLCTWIVVGDCACLEEEDAELMCVPDSADCSAWFLLEMMQPDGYSIFWDYGDGASETGYYLWSEHQYAESGTYEACATVTSPACPEGSTWCIEVVVEDCPVVECELDIVVDWTDPEAGWALLIADGAPEGAVVEWFNEDGDLIATGEVADLVDVGGGVRHVRDPDARRWKPRGAGPEACEFEGLSIEAIRRPMKLDPDCRHRPVQGDFAGPCPMGHPRQEINHCDRSISRPVDATLGL